MTSTRPMRKTCKDVVAETLLIRILFFTTWERAMLEDGRVSSWLHLKVTLSNSVLNTPMLSNGVLNTPMLSNSVLMLLSDVIFNFSQQQMAKMIYSIS